MVGQPRWAYEANKRQAEQGNAQAVNWMNSLPPLAAPKAQGWTPAPQSGFTSSAGYTAPAGRPQYVQAQRYTNPARPAYSPPPQSAQQRVVYKIMENKAPAYNPGMPIAANAAMGAPMQQVMHR